MLAFIKMFQFAILPAVNQSFLRSLPVKSPCKHSLNRLPWPSWIFCMWFDKLSHFSIINGPFSVGVDAATQYTWLQMLLIHGCSCWHSFSFANNVNFFFNPENSHNILKNPSWLKGYNIEILIQTFVKYWFHINVLSLSQIDQMMMLSYQLCGVICDNVSMKMAIVTFSNMPNVHTMFCVLHVLPNPFHYLDMTICNQFSYLYISFLEAINSSNEALNLHVITTFHLIALGGNENHNENLNIGTQNDNN